MSKEIKVIQLNEKRLYVNSEGKVFLNDIELTDDLYKNIIINLIESNTKCYDYSMDKAMRVIERMAECIDDDILETIDELNVKALNKYKKKEKKI